MYTLYSFILLNKKMLFNAVLSAGLDETFCQKLATLTGSPKGFRRGVDLMSYFKGCTEVTD
jgi:hypothetical protein